MPTKHQCLNIGYQTCSACDYNAARRSKRAAARNALAAAPKSKSMKRRIKAPRPPIVAQLPAHVKQLKNHFVLVRDCSGSMRAHQQGAFRLFQEQLKTLQANDQQNSVTVFDFGRDPLVDERCFNLPAKECSLLRFPYETDGGCTPLYDAVVKAAGRAEGDLDPDMSFVVIVLTDGQENASQLYRAADLREKITQLQLTDRWTFAFLVPPGYKSKFCHLSGVPAGNVQEWSDVERAAEDVRVGTMSYLSERKTSGGTFTRSTSYFTTDLSGVSQKDLANLHDVTAEVKVFNVDKECPVQTFVDFKTGGQFSPGSAFYEVMKKEDALQDYKGLLIMDKATKRIYGDGACGGSRHSVRGLLGLPEVGTVKLDPGNHANYKLFAQSTSTNRILPRGTQLAFWKK